MIELEDNMEPEDVEPIVKSTNRAQERCGKFLNNFNLFNTTSSLTLDGERRVKSVCGGVCCLILLTFIFLVTYHFLSIYFNNNDYILSYEKKLDDANDIESNIALKVGENFKFVLGFI